jgi:hypothetical protein
MMSTLPSPHHEVIDKMPESGIVCHSGNCFAKLFLTEEKRDMELKNKVAWWLINDIVHPALTKEDQVVAALQPIAGTMFPGINYFSLTGFGSAMRTIVIPALKLVAPQLVGAPIESFDPEDSIEIPEILPSQGCEWQNSDEWEIRFKDKLEALGGTPATILAPASQHPRHLEFAEKLMAMATTLANDPSSRLRVAFQEEDESEAKAVDANRFLKLDGRRVGRDIKTYAFMAKLGNWETTLCDVFAEIFMPLQTEGLASYPEALKMLQELGHEVYEPEKHAEWDQLTRPMADNIPVGSPA